MSKIRKIRDYVAARTDPRQMSLFGEGHTKELNYFYDLLWTSIEEEMPKPNMEVLAIIDGRIEELYSYPNGEFGVYFTYLNGSPASKVTHWRYLDGD